MSHLPQTQYEEAVREGVDEIVQINETMLDTLKYVLATTRLIEHRDFYVLGKHFFTKLEKAIRLGEEAKI